MKPTKNEIETTNFKVSYEGSCKASKAVPNQKAIKTTLASAKKKWLSNNAIIIARYEWLKRHDLMTPENMELPNLYLKIKNGYLANAFYSNVLTHVIKKQKYHIQILN